MKAYTTKFRVRQSEIDSFGHVNQAAYANYLQEAAVEASASQGFTAEWYAENKTVWVIRKLSIRYFCQARYGDELEAATWISDLRRANSNREYLITRLSDGAKVVRARANWVYVSRENFHPTRIPIEFRERFTPTNEQENLGIRLTKAEPTPDAFRYITNRRVQVRELDTSQHVNHTIYLQWVEQAYFDAMRAAGHAVEKTRKQDWFAFQGGHEIEYFESAFDNDEIEIYSWICETGRVRGAWTHEIYNAQNNKLLARDYSLGVFVDPEGKPIPAPPAVINDVLRGGQQK